jgi:ADP-ribosylglycohydrolase
MTYLRLKVLASFALAAGVASGQSAANLPKDRFFARIYGSVAAANIANSMGVEVEGWTWERIEKTHGLVDSWKLEGERTGGQAARQPGWGEDGWERYKLLASAIIRKGGRISIEDLAREWVEKLDPMKFGQGWLHRADERMYNLLKAGMPPWETGRYTPMPSAIGTAKMAAALGIVNAGNPENAGRDALLVTLIKDARGLNNFGVETAAAMAASVAEALRPGATVNSVIQAGLAQLPNERLARGEVEAYLALTQKVKDYKELRVINAERYATRRLGVSPAIEVFGSGLVCFRLADGRPREAMITAINIGRDTDCRTYVAGSLAGALRGIEAVPADWVATVEKGALTDPVSVDKRTARELALGLYKAALNEHARAKTAAAEVDSLLAK